MIPESRREASLEPTYDSFNKPEWTSYIWKLELTTGDAGHTQEILRGSLNSRLLPVPMTHREHMKPRSGEGACNST